MPLDFDGDGHSDILLRHRQTAEALVLAMQGATVAKVLPLPEIPDTTQVVGNGDYDGDGFADALCRDEAGNLELWRIHTGAVVSRSAVGTALPSGTQVVGSGDFDGDGRSDLAVRNPQLGTFAIWYLAGSEVLDTLEVADAPRTGWRAVGSGDYTADGLADVLWHKRKTGELVLWEFVGGSLSETPLRATAQGLALFAVGDLDGDGRSDFAVRKDRTKAWHAALMLAGGLGESIALPRADRDPTPRPVATGDYDADGRADLVVRDRLSKRRFLYFMRGTNLEQMEALPDVEAGWYEAGVGD
jgi:hypothetical protein